MKSILIMKMAFIFAAVYCLEARQIRVNRFGIQSDDDIEVEAIVRELKPTPYPASGYRPSRAFNFAGEAENNVDTNADTTLQDTSATTTESFDGASTTISTYGAESTTLETNAIPAEQLSDESNVQQPQEQKEQTPEETTEKQGEEKGSEASVYEGKTPYPPAGYRPSRAFNLPNEIKNLLKQETTTNEVTTEASIATTSSFLEEQMSTTTESSTESTESVENSRSDGYTTTTPDDSKRFDIRTSATTDTNFPLVNENASSITGSVRNPTDDKTPYPPAGFRPRCPFNLPTEELPNSTIDINSEAPLKGTKKFNKNGKTNGKHPSCGTNTNPLAPKPPKGSTDDPDSESIWIISPFQSPIETQPVLRTPTLLDVEAVAPSSSSPSSTLIPIQPILAIRSQPLLRTMPSVHIASRQFVSYAPVQLLK